MNNQKSIVFAIELAFEIVLSLCIPLFLGIYLNNKLDINPLGILGGAFLGIACAFTILFRFGVKKNDK